MRTIKFRALDKLELKWVYVEITTGEPEFEFDGKFNWHDLTPWQQFTGLYDKNGKEIYRGHIVRIDKPGWTGITEVIWDENRAGFRFATLSGARMRGNTKEIKQKEIIGDIYTTPELLK